jgi:phenylpropionate dioxygenase-like ring-hydroxylating dioxygenase large terminal subunit
MVVQHEVAIGLMRRALTLIETQTPELADRHMRVPLDYYGDPALAAKEKELFETSPLALVAASEIGQPHDYVVRNAVGRSVLLTRDEDGTPHAFLNYCRHRGAEPAQGCGNTKRFSCPYHAWTYDSKGHLTGMPLRQRYQGLDLAELGLVELPSQERHGFLWVVLTPGHPIDVAAHLGLELDAEIASLGCDRMSYYSSLAEAPLHTGWKSVAEGLLEGLHLPHVHSDTFNLNPQASHIDLAFYDRFGPHIRWGMALFGKDDVARLRATPESEWKPMENIGCIWLISPGLLLSHELYGLIYADLTPGSAPHESFLRYGWLSPVKEPPAGMPSPEDMAARAARGVQQDAPVWEGCGRGLARGAHGYALIGRNEKGVQLFHEQLSEQIGYYGLRYC